MYLLLLAADFNCGMCVYVGCIVQLSLILCAICVVWGVTCYVSMYIYCGCWLLMSSILLLVIISCVTLSIIMMCHVAFAGCLAIDFVMTFRDLSWVSHHYYCLSTCS